MYIFTTLYYNIFEINNSFVHKKKKTGEHNSDALSNKCYERKYVNYIKNIVRVKYLNLLLTLIKLRYINLLKIKKSDSFTEKLI